MRSVPEAGRWKAGFHETLASSVFLGLSSVTSSVSSSHWLGQDEVNGGTVGRHQRSGKGAPCYEDLIIALQNQTIYT